MICAIFVGSMRLLKALGGMMATKTLVSQEHEHKSKSGS